MANDTPARPLPAAPHPDLPPGLHDRFRGALLGLAVGDAMGVPLEFQPPGSFAPVHEMVGGGVFALPPGAWTDDTSMALCLAESLLACDGHDAVDQLSRYVAWHREGHLSSIGRCFDIGNTVREALGTFEATGRPDAGVARPNAAGNGAIMRLAPVPLFYFGDPAALPARARESALTTHATPAAVDACVYLADLIRRALAGEPKEALLAPWTPPAGVALDPAIAAIAAGSFKAKQPPAIRGTGYVVDSLEAALWAFHHGAGFEAGCLLAINLGNDADTTGAVYGQLAGAHYGEAGIPARWRATLMAAELVAGFADRLFARATGRPAV